MIKFSIIIPLFNSKSTILRTLKSLKHQIFENFECVIIDDKSTDSSLGLIKSFVKSYISFNIFLIPIFLVLSFYNTKRNFIK